MSDPYCDAIQHSLIQHNEYVKLNSCVDVAAKTKQFDSVKKYIENT